MRTIYIGIAAAFLAWGCGSVVHEEPDGADADASRDDAVGEDGTGDVDPEDGAGEDGTGETFECDDDGDCDDGNPCNGEESCDAGSCVSGTLPEDGTPCDDGDPCTAVDVCREGGCVPGEPICRCDTTADCAEYEDDDRCNGTLVCDEGACVVDPATIVHCTSPEERPCREYACLPDTGECDYVATPGEPCDDGNACSEGDRCSEAGVCVSSVLLPGADCDGACVDLSSDPAHCGTCETACATGDVCRDGVCTSRGWEVVAGVVNPVTLASAHALAAEGTTPYVAWTTAASVKSLWVYRPAGAVGWSSFGAGSATAVATAVQPVVDLAFLADTPYVAFADDTSSGAGVAVRVRRAETLGWREVGTPGWTSPCVLLSSLALALDADRPHVAMLGSGGCGIGVGYARWTGSAWWSTPQPPGPMPGLITMSGGGSTDVVFDGTAARVGLIDSRDRFVRAWTDGSPGSWANLGAALDFGTSDIAAGDFTSDQLALAANSAGNLFFAWSEVYGSGGAEVRGVFVRRWDPGARSWTLLGSGRINDGTQGDDPHVALIGGSPYVVYRDAGPTGGWQVLVKRWSGTTWVAVGGPVNADATSTVGDPQIANVAGVPHVAFRQPAGSDGGRIHVLRWPW
jgi:hypothetical protein